MLNLILFWWLGTIEKSERWYLKQSIMQQKHVKFIAKRYAKQKNPIFCCFKAVYLKTPVWSQDTQVV